MLSVPLLAADVCAEVGAELLQAGARAQETGIEPWRMLLDPGLGFAKTQASNLTLLSHLPDVRRALDAPGALRRAPLLLGPSRKGFLGRITGACCAVSCGVCCTYSWWPHATACRHPRQRSRRARLGHRSRGYGMRSRRRRSCARAQRGCHSRRCAGCRRNLSLNSASATLFVCHDVISCACPQLLLQAYCAAQPRGSQVPAAI